MLGMKSEVLTKDAKEEEERTNLKKAIFFISQRFQSIKHKARLFLFLDTSSSKPFDEFESEVNKLYIVGDSVLNKRFNKHEKNTYTNLLNLLYLSF